MENLPLVAAACVAIISGGIIVTKTGHATPFMVLGSALVTVACGLLYTLDVDTSSSRWIGYQIFAGFSIAFPFQNALNVAQADAAADDMATVTAALYFFQILGGAFSVSAAQSAFVSVMVANLPADVNALVVVATGASDLRSVFPADQVPGIVLAYMEGIKVSFAVATAMAGLAFVFSLVCPMKRLRGVSGENMAL